MGFSFILLAGGDSNRFKSKIPKQYHKIAGKTLISISIDKIREFTEITKIVFVFNKKHKKYLDKINLKDVISIKGGNTRKQSTINALNYLKKHKNTNKVLIHDAARPNFSLNLIKKIIKASKKNKTVVPVLKLQDSLKQKGKTNQILSLIRNNYFSTQTPQCFDLNEIFLLHTKKKKKYIDDDFSLIDKTNRFKFINGEKQNFKITDKQDLDLLIKYNKSNISSGIGFDVHRLIKGKNLYLGGINVPSKLGTLGHSDGDPVLHAIIDAILGACRMGDIGEKFSDKNKKFKNIRSDKLLKKIIKEIKERNYLVNNIDVNIIAEQPKLKKYKKKIIQNIANLCEISLNNVNVKAKTTEKLGVIGKKKAIAAEVIVSVIKYD
jgi:2-C-methyl-D-erythritol 4-phosphate cytidylyltransferase/2-C-methyl-D-erythritol 2,4-cyclodiphosphate synthase